MRKLILALILGAAMPSTAHEKHVQPRPPSFCDLADIRPGHHFIHDGSLWMRCDPEWTGDDDSDEAMLAGVRAEKDVADGGTVRIWCVRLTSGARKTERGGLRPIFETCTVQRP